MLWHCSAIYFAPSIRRLTYVSCALVNSSGTVTHYGQIAQNSESGKEFLTIPTGLSAGSYTLRVFTEQLHAGNHTDFASVPVNISLTVDDARPTVNSVTPDGNAVPLNGDIVITFSEPMDTNVAHGTVALNNNKGQLSGGS